MCSSDLSVAVSLRPTDFERRHRAIAPVLRDAADRVGRALRAAEGCPVRSATG